MALIRLAASLVIEQNDEWLVGRRYLSQHTLDSLSVGAEADQQREETPEEVLALSALSSRRSCRRVTPRPGT